LDGYLDGREDRIGCEDGEELCDVCSGGVEEEGVEDEEQEERIEEQEEQRGG
jgi:hypothetical protein